MLEAHTAFTNLTAGNAIAEDRALENITTRSRSLDNIAPSQAFDNATSTHTTAQAYASEVPITQARGLVHTTSENASAELHTPENVTSQNTSAQACAPVTRAQGLNNATSEEAVVQAYPSYSITQTRARNDTTSESAGAETLTPETTIFENTSAQACVAAIPLTQAQHLHNTISDGVIAQACPSNSLTEAPGLDHTTSANAIAKTRIPESITAVENTSPQACAAANSITEARDLNHATSEEAITQACSSTNSITQARALNHTTSGSAVFEARVPETTTTSENTYPQACTATNAITRAQDLDDASSQEVTAQSYPSRNSIAQTGTRINTPSENAVVEAHVHETTIASEYTTEQADAFNNTTSENAIAEAHTPEHATVSGKATATQALDRKRLHRKTGVYPSGSLRGAEAFSTSGSAATGAPTHIDDIPLGEVMARFMGEGEPEEGPSDEGEGEGEGEAREAEGLRGTNTSLDETSMWMSVMDEMANEDRPADVNPPHPLRGNPVTDGDREWVAEAYRRNEAARREAARSRPSVAAAHRGNVGHSDVIPMRQWKEEARRAGIPTSPDRPEEDGTPVRSSALSTLLRPLRALTGRAAAAVAFVRGKLQGRGKGKGKVKGPEGPEEEGPPPGLMTTRGHVENYTI